MEDFIVKKFDYWKSRIKKPLLFTAVLSPIIIVACWLVTIYAFSILAEEMQTEILVEMGYNLFILAGTIQSVIIAFLGSFFGYILAEKTGLLKSFRFEKEKLVKTLIVTIAGGILFSLDYWIFGRVIPGLQELTGLTIAVNAIFASILYGGIVEELLLRLFLMSLFVFILWKLFYRKAAIEQIPAGIYIVANVLAAVLFAAGHLPATVGAFGELTPLLLFRCFLLNGTFGLICGWLYKKYGIQYAMVSHAGFHIVSKAIWLVFI
jgi:hypothetical protein